MSDYYKSLVTDEEVIKALTRDSEAREGTLEKPKLRPNLNFLKRTVSNMVSSNNRLIAKQTNNIMKEKEKNSSYKPIKAPVRKKLHIDIIKDILTEKIDFVKSSENRKIETKYNPQQSRHIVRPQVECEPNRIHLPTNEKSIVRPKTQLEVVREILIGRIVSLKSSKAASNLSDSHKTSTKKLLANRKWPKMNHNSRKEDTQSSSDYGVSSLDQTINSSCSASSDFSKKKTKKCVSDNNRSKDSHTSHHIESSRKIINKYDEALDNDTSSSYGEVVILVDSASSSSSSDSIEFSKKISKNCFSDTSGSENSETSSHHKSSRRKRNKIDVTSDNNIGNPRGNPKKPLIDHISKKIDTKSSSDNAVIILDDSANSSSCSDCGEFSKKKTKKCVSSRKKSRIYNVASDNISHPNRSPKESMIHHTSISKDTQRCPAGKVIILDDSTSSSTCSNNSECPKKKMRKGKCKSSMKK